MSSSKSYIKKLKLENWRSFEECTIDFHPGLNVLVGANNAGKSNILEALHLLLGDVFISRFVPASTDFHRAVSKAFTISARISVPRQAVSTWPARAQNYANYAMGADPTNSNNCEVGIRRSCCQGKSPLTEFWNYSTKQWEDFSRYYLDQSFDFYYVRPVRDIGRHTATSYRSPLAEIRRVIDQRLDPHSADNISRLIAEANEHLMNDPALIGFQDLLETTVRDQTDLSRVSFSITAHTKSDLLKNLGIVGQDTFESGIETKGSGTQNSVILALFQILASITTKSVVFAFEEPEIGFHPHGQRQLAGVFNSLSQRAQVFIATHSVNLIDQEALRSLKRVVKEDGKSKVYSVPADARVVENLDRRFAGEATELLFASRVLFVEGPSEKGFLPAVSYLVHYPEADSRSLSFDRLNISVVSCEGNGSIPKYIRIAQSLGIPWIALVDRDKDLKGKFFKAMLNEGLIASADFDAIPEDISDNWVETNKPFLDRIACIICPARGFENEMLSCPRIYPKILRAVNRIRDSYDEPALDPARFAELTQPDQRQLLFKEMTSKKGRRLGYELGSALTDVSEIPPFFVSVVKSAVGV